MNKTDLITYLRDPNRLSGEQLEELEALVDEYPYFLSARLLLAKSSKEQNHPKTKKRIASAAVYSTDRVLLKKYLTGNLFFLSQPPKVEEDTSAGVIPSESKEAPKVADTSEENTASEPKSVERVPSPPGREEKVSNKDLRSDKRPSALKPKEERPTPEIPDVPSGHLDSILEELERDMENLKASRDKFAEVQQKIEEDDAVSAALERASVKESPKDSKEEVDSEKKIEENKDADEVRRAASAITMQILDAAKKAKEEVVREDAQEEENKIKATIDEPEISEEEKKETVKEEAEPQPEIKESSKKDDSDIEKSTDGSEKEDRAERVIREPRFSRFATRSYLKPPEHIDPTSFLDDDDDKKGKPEDKKEEKANLAATEPPIEKEEEAKVDTKGQPEESESETSSKIKLPDLSKAKPVARPSKRKTKKEGIEKGESSATDKKDGKKEVSKASVKEEDKSKVADESVEAKPTKTSKSSAKKDSEEKPAKKESIPAKKKTTTKTTVKKAAEKKAEVKKTPTKKTSAKKITTKKTVAKKEPAKKASSAKSTSKSKSSGTKEEKKDDGKGERKSQKAIIDKFIKDSPTIKYQRTDDSNLSDLAEESSSWDPNLASEYLAEIYLHQGNKKRAIEIYEALSLKYPEKKSYFADLISKIE